VIKDVAGCNPSAIRRARLLQVHYIVETGDAADTEQFLARCERITKGHFGDKRVVAVKWMGTSAFADKL